MDYRDEFNIITKAQKDREVQQNLDDLNNERRGVDAGRMVRFLSPEAREIISGERKNKKGAGALEIIMMSAEYMQAFEDADQSIREAQQKGGKVRTKLDQAIEQLQQEIDETLEAAVTLPDGRKAFMNKDGEVYTVEGERVDQAVVDGIDWTGRPSLERREDQLHRMEKLQELSREEQKLGLRLGELHNELHDDDKPSLDRVGELHKEADAIRDRYGEMGSTIGQLTQNNIEPENTPQAQIITPEKAVIPELG